MTAKFEILKGKALSAAIKGRAKVAATFTQREHQLALSCLVHVDEHHDVIYLNRLFEVTPQNYRGGLMKWAAAFGKCKFDSKAGEFTYVKGKKSDLEAAAKIAPANYQKEASQDSTPAEFDEVKALEKVIERFVDKDASPSVVQALQAALRVAKGQHMTVVEGSKAA